MIMSPTAHANVAASATAQPRPWSLTSGSGMAMQCKLAVLLAESSSVEAYDRDTRVSGSVVSPSVLCLHASGSDNPRGILDFRNGPF